MSTDSAAGSMHTPQFGTTGVVLNVTPTVIGTLFQHVVTWPTRRKSKSAPSGTENPTSIGTLPANQMSYDQGLHIVRSFLNYASEHGVEELQSFSAQPVPIPHWLRREVVKVPQDNIDRAAVILTKQLAKYADGKGLELVGGKKWWQVRGRPLEGEWIEMSKHYHRRMEIEDQRRAREGTSSTMNGTTDRAEKRKTWRHSTLGSLTSRGPKPVLDGSGAEVDSDRVIMYIHGGAFFFSSLDLHRYQIERHARKAGARAFVPNYRLSPQYPFPCGLLDSLAAYLYLIEPPEGIKPIDPKNIILMGDSAGGGMTLSLLVVIREMGLPMPAAASLMSPWVDLTHSMPSIHQWDGGDYIPNVGFHYRPSLVWPPVPVPENGIKVTLQDGTEKVIDDQIQVYCPNNLLTHPLVSPINNGSLGALCPLYITAGSAELLRDEVIYVAHKAADPQAYPPAAGTLAEFPEQAALVDRYPPTKVHLQVFEGACHVATTLAWTRSAKYIFRGTANFNIWAFRRAQRLARRSTLGSSVYGEAGTMSRSGSEGASGPSTPGVGGPVSRAQTLGMTQASPSESAESTDSADISDGTDSEAESVTPKASKRHFRRTVPSDHMQVRGVEPRGSAPIVAERVSVHGRITPMEPDSEVQALDPKLKPSVGRIRSDGPVGRWIDKRETWDKRWPDDLRKWREIRARDRAQAERQGFLTKTLQGEHPPPSALAGMADPELARKVGKSVDEPSTKTTVPVLLWSQLASKRDAEAAEDEDGEKKDNPLKRMISGQSQADGESNILTRIISGKQPREDGGPSPTDSEKATAAGVAAEEAKMANAGKSISREEAAGGAALAGAGVAAAAGVAAVRSRDAAPHTVEPVADHDEHLSLSRVSSAGSEYVLAQETIDTATEADGIRQFVVTETITSDPDSYDRPDVVEQLSPANGIVATDYAATTAKAPEAANVKVVTPIAQQSTSEGETSALSTATAVDSSIAPAATAASLASNQEKSAPLSEKQPQAAAETGQGATAPISEKQPELAAKKPLQNGAGAGAGKVTVSKPPKASDDYADLQHKGLWGKLHCC